MDNGKNMVKLLQRRFPISVQREIGYGYLMNVKIIQRGGIQETFSVTGRISDEELLRGNMILENRIDEMIEKLLGRIRDATPL